MYRIIGADQKEYGPVDADRIRRWISEGRANGESRVKREGEEWTKLSAMKEFARDLHPSKAPAVPSLPPPRVSAVDADRLANDIITRGFRIDIGDCFNRSWNLLQENFWTALAGSAVIVLIYIGLLFIPTFGYPAAIVLTGPLFGGLYWFFLRMIRKESAEVGDVFSGFGAGFIPLMLAGIVQNVLIDLGLVLCIVPGLYLMTIWLFAFLLIVDRKMDFWPAMELSRKVVHEQWWPLFGLMLLTFILCLAGFLLLCVGILVTAPLAAAAVAYAYEDIFGKRTTQSLPGTGLAKLKAKRTAPTSPSPASARPKAKLPEDDDEAEPSGMTPSTPTTSAPSPKPTDEPVDQPATSAEPGPTTPPDALPVSKPPKKAVRKSPKRAGTRKSAKSAEQPAKTPSDAGDSNAEVAATPPKKAPRKRTSTARKKSAKSAPKKAAPRTPPAPGGSD